MVLLFQEESGTVSRRKEQIVFSRLENAIISKVNGCTAMRDAIKHAISTVSYGKQQYRQREILVFTDGDDNSSQCSHDELRKLMRSCTPSDGKIRHNLSITLIGISYFSERELKQLCEPEHCQYLSCDTAGDAIVRSFEKSSQQIFERKREIVLTLKSSGTGTQNLNPLQLQQFMNMLSIGQPKVPTSTSLPRISEVSTSPSHTKNVHKPKKTKNKNRNPNSNPPKKNGNFKKAANVNQGKPPNAANKAKFCCNCGKKIFQGQFCSHCGHKV